MGRAWDIFVAQDVGSTSRGFLSGALEAVFGIAAVAAMTGYALGLKELQKHWVETAIIALFAIPTVTFVVYGTQFAWEVAKAGYADHLTLVDKVRILESQKVRLVDPESRDAQIAELKAKLNGKESSSISSVTKELLPVETFASHGLPTTETYVTAHGTISDPTFVLECNSPCAYEIAQSLAPTSTLPESKQLSPTRIWVHFVVPAQLSDAQQVAIRVRSESHDPIHTIKVRRVTK